MSQTLKTEGIPPIPAPLARELERHGEIRYSQVLDWHPRRRELLISTRFGEVPHLHRLSNPMGARLQLTFGSNPIERGLYEPTRGRFLVFIQDADGDEADQFYRLDLQNRRVSLLTDGQSRNTAPLFSRDGRFLYYTSTRRNGRDTDIWRMDPQDPQSARLLVEVKGGGWSVADTSPDGSILLILQRLGATQSVLHLADAASGRLSRLSPEGRAVFQQARFIRGGRSILCTTDLGSEYLRLATLDLSSRRLRFLHPDSRWDTRTLALSRNNQRLAYLQNENGLSVLHVLDLASGREFSLPALPKGTTTDLVWSPDGAELAFNLDSARTPSDIFSIRIQDRRLTRWTRGETGYVNPDLNAEPETVRWTSFDGQRLSGFLYRPSPARFPGPRPVLLVIHGGPEDQFQPFYLGENNHLINDLGCALIFPNVRGSSGYGKTFLDLDNGTKREDSVRDIGTLLDWIATHPGLDANRVMVSGGSYGGYMTLACLIHFGERILGGINSVGISNFVTFLESTSGYRQDLRRAEYGDERDPAMRAFLERISPLTHASRITRPLLIVQGKNDPRVPLREALQMVEILRANHRPVWYLEAADEGHGFTKKQNRAFEFAVRVMFIRKYLLGEESPKDSGKEGPHGVRPH